MTDDMIVLRRALEKGYTATLPREMAGFGADQLMELETEALSGAGHGERSAALGNMAPEGISEPLGKLEPTPNGEKPA